MQTAFVPPEILTMTEMEIFLSKNAYLSGTDNPAQVDSKIIDCFKQSRLLPDRSVFPNCFSWYWSLVGFSTCTKMLWSPRHAELEKPGRALTSKPTKQLESNKTLSENSSTTKEHSDWEIYCNTLDFPGGSPKCKIPGRGEEAIRVSPVLLPKRSSSVSSNDQDAHSLVHAFGSSRSISRLRSQLNDFEAKSSRARKTSKNLVRSRGPAHFSVRESHKNVRTITSKVFPQRNTNKLQVCELLTNSFESTILQKSSKDRPSGSSEVCFRDSARLHFLDSVSQKETPAKEKVTVEISANYSFLHKASTLAKTKHSHEKISKLNNKHKNCFRLDRKNPSGDNGLSYRAQQTKNVAVSCKPRKSKTTFLERSLGSKNKTGGVLQTRLARNANITLGISDSKSSPM